MRVVQLRVPRESRPALPAPVPEEGRYCGPLEGTGRVFTPTPRHLRRRQPAQLWHNEGQLEIVKMVADTWKRTDPTIAHPPVPLLRSNGRVPDQLHVHDGPPSPGM